jgi:penicillin-binding protein 2
VIPAKPPSRTHLQLRFRGCVTVAGIVFLILAARLFHLQVVKGLSYRYQSENNRIRAERLPPPRGLILDRNGVTLADMRAAFDARIVPSDVPKERAPILYSEVAKILEMEPSKIAEVANNKSMPKWRPRLLKRRLTWEQMAQMEARRIELPGFYVAPNPVRHYPFAGMLSSTLGYLGGITQQELDSPEFAGYDIEDWLGRAGVERSWESHLRGTPGGEQVEVDVVGQRLGTLVRRSAKPGQNLVLTIDERIQEAAENTLGEQVGSAVAIHIPTGGILAMVSHPSYDPNVIAQGMTGAEWSALSTDENHPLQNRPVQGQYAPGSTFKIMMALAGLETGAITPDTAFSCNGRLNFAGRDFRCWNKRGHGTVNLGTALEQSCDVYFYRLGLELGVDAIHKYATMLGLGAPTGIDLPGEKSGLIPSSEWKQRVRKEPWYAGETLSISIGQGYVTTTPIQLAAMTAAIASGKRMKPHLVLRVEDVEGHTVETVQPEELGRLPVNDSSLMYVRDGMRRVVNSPGGTAQRAKVDGYTMAGKTGTAQVIGIKREGVDLSATEWKYKDHALFVAYAPYDDPQIAIVVVVDHGGHGGSVAAPIASAMVAAYRDCLDPKFAFIPEEGPPRPEIGPPRSLMTMGFRRETPAPVGAEVQAAEEEEGD